MRKGVGVVPTQDVWVPQLTSGYSVSFDVNRHKARSLLAGEHRYRRRLQKTMVTDQHKQILLEEIKKRSSGKKDAYLTNKDVSRPNYKVRYPQVGSESSQQMCFAEPPGSPPPRLQRGER